MYQNLDLPCITPFSRLMGMGCCDAGYLWAYLFNESESLLLVGIFYYLGTFYLSWKRGKSPTSGSPLSPPTTHTHLGSANGPYVWTGPENDFHKCPIRILFKLFSEFFFLNPINIQLETVVTFRVIPAQVGLFLNYNLGRLTITIQQYTKLTWNNLDSEDTCKSTVQWPGIYVYLNPWQLNIIGRRGNNGEVTEELDDIYMYIGWVIWNESK